jgi:hypothetical protein
MLIAYKFRENDQNMTFVNFFLGGRAYDAFAI